MSAPTTRKERGASPIILAVDSGKSSCKVVAIDAEGRIVSETSAPHTLIQSRPGWAEQDAEEWWQAVAGAVRAVPRLVRKRVACITVTSQREGLVPVDGSGKPLAHCMVWLDRRSESELPSIEQKISDRELFLLTGLRLDSAFSLPRLLWLRRHQPDLIKRAAYLLQPSDFLLAQLTGRFVSDLAVASRTALVGVKNRRWSQRVLDLFAVDSMLLPVLVDRGVEMARSPRQQPRRSACRARSR